MAIEKKCVVDCVFDVFAKPEVACTARDIFYWDNKDETWGRIAGSQLTQDTCVQKTVSETQYLSIIFGV